MSKHSPPKVEAPELSPVAEKIATVAGDLFYRQGYRATGVNEVIKKAEVAKATFYHHFPTKDDLFLTCLKRLHEAEVWYLEGAIAAALTPLDKLMAPIDSLTKWLIDNNYRGCGFVNTAAEIPDIDSPLRQEGKILYYFIAKRIRELTQSLISSDPNQYGRVDVDAFAQQYFHTFAGAVMLAGMYHEAWPVEQASRSVRGLLASMT